MSFQVRVEEYSSYKKYGLISDKGKDLFQVFAFFNRTVQ